MHVSRLRLALTPGAMVTIAAALALWIALSMVVALLLWNARQREIGEAKLRGAATTALLQAHTANTFRAVDNALVDIVKSLERHPLPRHDEQLRNQMRQRLSTMPYVRALFVIGSNGYIQHDTDYSTTPDVSLADRPYFQQHEQGDTPDMTISSPILSRSGTGWFVAVTRRIGSGTDFRGVAVAAIKLSYFFDLYKTVGIHQGSEIFLFQRDGTLLAEYPGTAGTIGQSYAEFPLFNEHLNQASSGAYLTSTPSLPYLRLVSYSAVDKIPLVVAKTQNMQDRLRTWKQAAVLSSVAMVLFLAGLVYGVIQYLHFRLDQLQQRERMIQGEKMEALGEMTGGIAHDFANILGVVATNLALLKKISPIDGRTDAALGRAQRAVKNGTVLTTQLMSFSRKRELDVTEFDVNEVISSVFGLLEHAAGPDRKLVFEPCQTRTFCRLDRSHFEIALINLVVNARHATDSGGRITMTTRSALGAQLKLPTPVHRRKFVCVTVADDGKGMTEEIRRRAIEPFFTTKGEQGTGFGLAQVYGFMHQLGGELTIESKVGVGTSIQLCFVCDGSAGD